MDNLTLIENNPEFKEAKKKIEDNLVKQFQRMRNIGVKIGYNSALIIMEEKISKMTNAKQIKKYVKEAADKARNEMNEMNGVQDVILR